MKRDGTFIDINDFDPVELGPFPKCHPHFEEHQTKAENGTMIWVKNHVVGSAGPFPVGHPENPEWVEKSHKAALEDNKTLLTTWAGIQPNLHLLSLVLICVYLGSLHGVWLWTEDIEHREPGQLLQHEDAAWFPVMGSCTLFGLFLVLKYLGTEYVKLLISAGVVFLCMFGIGSNMEHLYAVFRKKVSQPLFVIPYFDEPVTAVELVGMIIGSGMAVGFMFTKSWIINNVFGCSFCLLGIKMIGLSNWKTGAIMLVGLFFYDVFWVFGSKSVFGSNVMVSVAQGIEAPIKLQFPRRMGGCGVLQHSMLGLGDIVVPGIFIAFLAKWDAVKIADKKANGFVYLHSVMVAYFFSLVTTVGVMFVFNAAQPALLYIVPYVLITSIIVAVARGEMKELWTYTISDEKAPTPPEEAKKNE